MLFKCPLASLHPRHFQVKLGHPDSNQLKHTAESFHRGDVNLEKFVKFQCESYTLPTEKGPEFFTLCQSSDVKALRT